MTDSNSGHRQLAVRCAPELLEIYRPGQAAPLLVQRAQPDRRPYIHPILSPDGSGVLTEDAPAHHPWQHGLYVGLNDVNGIGFWTEGLTPKAAHDGSFHPLPLTGAEVAGNQVSWRVRTEWRDPQGELMLTDEQAWTFTDLGDRYELDLAWRLDAAIDLLFGQYAYGGLFVRMPYRKELGGSALTSEGAGAKEAEGQRARWVAVQMPAAGEHGTSGAGTGAGGIAVMDHPSNPEHPVPWRVDGELGFSPSCCIAGSWKLQQGESRRFQHRVLVFSGGINKELIEVSWNHYSGRVHI
jgi:hypothetical protein